MTSFNDYLYTHQVVSKRPRFTKMLDDNRLNLSDYVLLYSPAVEWILQCIAHKADLVSCCSLLCGGGGAARAIANNFFAHQHIFETILGKCKEASNGLVLNHVVSSFHPDYIAANAGLIANLIKDSDGTFPKVLLLLLWEKELNTYIYTA